MSGTNDNPETWTDNEQDDNDDGNETPDESFDPAALVSRTEDDEYDAALALALAKQAGIL